MISNLDTIIEAGSGNTHKSDCTTKQKRQVRENSYSNVIRQHVQSLNVAKEEQQRYYSVVHTIMAEAGIIDSQKTADANEKDKRYKRVCFKSAGRKNARFCAFFGAAESKFDVVSETDTSRRTDHMPLLEYA